MIKEAVGPQKCIETIIHSCFCCDRLMTARSSLHYLCHFWSGEGAESV